MPHCPPELEEEIAKANANIDPESSRHLALPGEAAVTPPPRVQADEALNPDGSVNLEAVRQSIRERVDTQAKGFIDTANPVVTRALDSALARLDFEDVGRIIGQNNLNLNRLQSEDGLKNFADEVATLIRSRSPKSAANAKSVTVEKSAELGQALAEREAKALGLTGTEEVGLLNSYQQFFGETSDLHVRINALRVLEVSLETDLAKLSNKMLNGGDSTNVAAEFLLRRDQLLSIAEVRSGVATNIGRALGSYRAIAKPLDLGPQRFTPELRIADLADIVDNAGGVANVRVLATQVRDALNNRVALRKVLERQGRTQLAQKMVLEYWLNSILSGPITQAVNVISNTAVGLWVPAELLVHGAVHGDRAIMNGALKEYQGLYEGFRAAFKMNAAGARAVQESLSLQLKGSPNAYRDSASLLGAEGVELGHAWRAFAQDSPSMIPGAAALDQVVGGQHAINAGNMYKLMPTKINGVVGEGTVGARMVDSLGSITRAPSRLLTTGDDMAKSINYHMVLNRLANENSTTKGLTGLEADARRRQLVQDVPDWEKSTSLTDVERREYAQMDAQAKRQATVRTFTDPLADGSANQKIQNFVREHPTARIAVPFIRTPLNILKFTFERTPGIQRVTQEWKAAKAAADAGDKAPRSLLRTKTAIATGVYFVAGMAAIEGKITGGGPSNGRQREALKAAGWKPYSMRFQNDDGTMEYVAYNRLDPFGLFLGIAADVGETIGHMEGFAADEMAVAAVVGVVSNLKSKSYFQGITNVVSALSDPERNFARWGTSLAASFAPNLFAQANRTAGIPGVTEADPVMREVESLLDAFKARTPGFSADLPPSRNIFGEIQTFPMGWGPDTISPFYSSTSANTPLDRELIRLAQNHGFGVSVDAVYSDIDGVELTPEEKDRFIVLGSKDLSRNGNDARKTLDNLIQTEEYRRAGDGADGRQALIKQRLRRLRARARRRMIEESPDLAARVRAARLAKRNERLATDAASTSPGGSALLEALTQRANNQ